MNPFWVELPVQVEDGAGRDDARILCNDPQVFENHRLELRGTAFLFDEIEELFAKHLDESARLTWTIDVDVDCGEERKRRRLRVDGRKHVAREAVVGTFPRPSFFIRVALTMDSRTVVSRWHIDWEGGFEDALADLRRELGESATVHACFFCKWSDYAPSSSTGNLRCFRAVKSEYEAIATSADNWTRKYKKESLFEHLVNVDELNVCAEFTKRPRGFGYRG